MRISKVYSMAVVALILFSWGTAYPQNEKEEAGKNNKKGFFLQGPAVKLTRGKVIDLLMRENSDIKKTLLDYRGATLNLKKYRGKFDIILFGGGGYSHGNSLNQFSGGGQASDTYTYSGGLMKTFRSGTSLSASITGVKNSSPNTYIPIGSNFINFGGTTYNTNIKVELTQELLKNSFGMKDRLTERQLRSFSEVQKELVKVKLAALLVDAIVSYWNVSASQELVVTSRTGLESTTNIRNLIARKLRLGLSEREDILEWNGKVLQSRNELEKSEKAVFDAKLKVIRLLNMEPTRDIEVDRAFSTDEPTVTYEQAVKEAYTNRADWEAQKIAVENAKMGLRIARGDMLPSMKLKLGAGNNPYNRNDNIFSRDSYSDTLKSKALEYSANVELSYPLMNKAARASVSEARLTLKQAELDLEKLEKEIRDEIASNVKECESSYTIYVQTRQAREYAQNYYYQVLAKFRRGRYQALQIKLALDAYMQARYAEIGALIGYNIALMKLDLSRNVVFDRLGIDIDAILKRIEN